MAQFSSRPRHLSGARTLVAGSLCAAGLALFIAGEWAGVEIRGLSASRSS